MRNNNFEELGHNDFEVIGMMRAICNLNRIGESVEFIAEGLGLSEACVNRVLSFAPYFEQTKNSRREARHEKIKGVETVEKSKIRSNPWPFRLD